MLNSSILIDFPAYVYHGTLLTHLNSFKEKLINPEKWNPNRDFGKGFYTTIDLEQAQVWGFKNASEHPRNQPLVLKIKIDISQFTRGSFNQHHFLGDSFKWAKFILNHRRYTTLKFDPCEGENHPAIISGPMADNDTGLILEEFEQNEDKDEIWFYNNITKNKFGLPLFGLELGNQLVFCNSEIAIDVLTLEGWYEYNPFEERWDYYEYKKNKTL